MAGARPDTWMPMYWGDYLKDTSHLSTTEHGAYLLLIGHYWSSGQPLPDDDAQLRRIAKVEGGAQWKRLRPVLAAFFHVGAGLWRHGRIEGELSEASKRSKKAKTRAKKAADARWQGQHDEVPEDPHGGEDDADEDDAPGMQKACSKHSVSDAPSIAAAKQASPDMTEFLEKNGHISFADIEPENAQPIEIAINRDACSSPQAMLEQCPSQPQSYLPPATVEKSPPESDEDSSSSSARDMVDRAYQLWLPVAYELRIPDSLFLNEHRRVALAARLAECGSIERWTQALQRLREAEFLRDPDDPSKPIHWLNLATLLKPENFTGLLEGRYAERRNDKANSRPADGGAPTVADGVSAAIARRYVPTGG